MLAHLFSVFAFIARFSLLLLANSKNNNNKIIIQQKYILESGVSEIISHDLTCSSC